MSFSPLSSVAQPVDRQRLDTDLEYRFQYVSAFCGFDETDIAALHAVAPVLGPLVPTYVDAVYSKLFSFDLTKSPFTHRNEGYTGKVNEDINQLSVADEQIRFRKNHLSAYLVKLVTAEYDKKFITYLDRVGRMHVNMKTKGSHIHIDYIHVNALFGFVHSALVQGIDSHPDFQSPEKQKIRTDVLTALTKLLWIQNDLFTKYYVQDAKIAETNEENVDDAKKQTTTATTKCGALWLAEGQKVVGGLVAVGVLLSFLRRVVQ